MTKPLLSALATLTALLGCASTDPRKNVSSSLETPPYEVSSQDGRFELRRYAPYVVAQTRLQGSRDAASREGFRVLAGYIFGKNKARAKVAMTAPVAAEPVSERIAMTAPVIATPEGDAGSDTATWVISFMMPSQYTLDTLPVPDDPRVQLTKRPASCQAAVVFDGFTTASNVREHTEALQRWLRARELQAEGQPVLARYNDPWTLPMNRRNELLIRLGDAACGPPVGNAATR